MSRDTIKARKLLLELEKRKSESVEVMIYMSHPFLFNERFTDYKEKKKTKMCEWRGSSSFVNAFSFPLFWSLQGNEFDWNADAQCIIYETQKKLSIFRVEDKVQKSYLKILLSMISCCVKLESKQSPLKSRTRKPEILVKKKRGKNIKDWWILVKVRRRVNNPVSGVGLENA